MTKEVQTLWYRAPELLLGNKNYNYALDYWSLGVIAYELVYMRNRFKGTSEIDMLFKIFEQIGTPEFDSMQHIQDYESIDGQFKVSFPKFPPKALPLTKAG